MFVSWDISSSIADHPDPREFLSPRCSKAARHYNSAHTFCRQAASGEMDHACWCLCVLKDLYVLAFQLSMWPVIPNFEISVKEHRVIGAVQIKTNNTGWNLLWCFIFLNHQIWMPCWLPGCYRKSSGNSILRNGENVLLAKNSNLPVRVIPVALSCTLQTNLFGSELAFHAQKFS